MNQVTLFRIALIAAISWAIVMRLSSPPNIVQFELAKTTSVTSDIITTWGHEGVAKAKTSIYLDFIFIIFYCAAIALGCSVSARYSRSELLKKLGVGFIVLAVVAGGCDVIENIAMLQSLQEITQTSVSVAFYFAAVKFAILFASLAFALTGFAAGAIRKLRS